MPSMRAAGDPEFAARTRQQVEALARRTCYHSLELGDGTVIPGLIGVEALRARVRAFPIPENLAGKRVLDVGAASGWNSFEMERRGAEVVAVDCVSYEELPMARELLGSRVDYRILDMEEIGPPSVGAFDYVLFLGVLYHLRHPLLGLEKICAVTREAAFVESFVTDGGDAEACMLEFYETDELGGQIDNWCGPTTRCLLALCRAAGFARVNLEYVRERRAGVTCYRAWEPPSPRPGVEAPWISSAVNNRTHDVRFHPGKDEYICLYFRGREELSKEQLRVEVDGLGVPTLVLARSGAGEWQANLRVPPGLAPGPHEVRLRTLESGFGNTVSIEMEGAASPPAPRAAFSGPAPAPVIFALENSFDRTRVFHGYRNESLCCYFRTPEPDLAREDLVLEIDGSAHPVRMLSDIGGGQWQASLRLPAALESGTHAVRLRTARSPFSEAAECSFQLSAISNQLPAGPADG
jgi:tRNA (mo5U34)-methyltransferase